MNTPAKLSGIFFVVLIVLVFVTDHFVMNPARPVAEAVIFALISGVIATIIFFFYIRSRMKNREEL